MRIWLKTSVNSFLFPWIDGSARVAFLAEYLRLMWDATMASEACLVGIQRKRHDLLGSKVMREGGKKGVFEAWVNEVLSPVWGEEERMSKRLPVRQTVIPADGSFDSKDKYFRIHVHHLHPPRCKSGDSIQSLVLLERTKADLKRRFKDKTGVLWRHCCVSRSCFETYERIAASWEWLMQLSHSRQHLSPGLCANWHREHQGAPW